MRTVILITFFLAFGQTVLWSQGVPDEFRGNIYQKNGLEGFNVASVPSPEAASLGKYVQFPPANNTGTVSVDIPLGEVMDGDLLVPVSLSYHGSGIRVEDDPSMIGAGWTLMAGGVITRQVKGVPDDQVEQVLRVSNLAPANHYSLGWLCNYSTRKTLPDFPCTYHRWTQFPEIPRLAIGAIDASNAGMNDHLVNDDVAVTLSGAIPVYFDDMVAFYDELDAMGVDTACSREVAAARALQNIFSDRGDASISSPSNAGYVGANGPLNLGNAVIAGPVAGDSTNSRRSNLDRESDRFLIKAPGLSGSFIFDHDGKPRLIGSTSNYEIDYFIRSRNNPSNPSLQFDQGDIDNIHWTQWINNQLHIYKFEVVNELGITYIFDKVETTTTKDSTYFELNSGGQAPSQEIEHDPYNTAWFLSKMVAPDGREITFSYNSYEINSTRKRSAHYGPSLNGSCLTYHLTKSYLVQKTNSWVINKIESDHQEVFFQTDPHNRKDLPGGRRMESVTFYNLVNGTHVKVKRFYIGSEYLKGIDGINGDCGGFGGTTGNDDPYCWRLFLKSLCEEGYENLTVAHKPAYEFNYHGENLGHIFLPHRRKSLEKDFWGYFNAASTNISNNTEIPEIFIYPGETGEKRYRVFPLSSFNGNQIILGTTECGSNRMPDEQGMISGMLEEIKYPSGGTTNYEYKANTFLDIESIEREGAGVRIHKVINCDGNQDYPCIEKVYHYNKPGTDTTSGQLVQIPRFAYPTAYVKNPDGTLGLGAGDGLLLHHEKSGVAQEAELWRLFTKRQAKSILPLSDEAGAQVYYTNVTIDEGGIGKTAYEYFPARTYLSHAETIEIAPNQIYQQYLYRFEAVGDPVDNGIFESSGFAIPYYGTGCSPTSTDLDWGEIQTDGFNEFLPLPLKMDYEFPYGKLKSRTIFDENVDTLVREEFKYDTISNYHRQVQNLMFGDMNAFCDDQPTFIGFNVRISQPQAWRKFPIHTGIDWKMTEKVVRTYDQGITNNFIQSKEESTYEVGWENDPTVFLRSRKTFQSDGSELKTVFKYPMLDYFPLVSAGLHPDALAIERMDELHLFNRPVLEEIWQKKPGSSTFSLLTALFKKYREESPGIIVPKEVYSLNFASPLPSTSYTGPVLNDVQGFLLNSNPFKRDVTIDYNPEGKPIELTPEDGSKTSYIYGLDQNTVVATAQNAAAANIAYTGFEEDNEVAPENNGGWTISGTSGGWNGNLAKTGETSFDLSPNRSLAFIPASPGTYVCTYWALNQLVTNVTQTVIKVSDPDADGFRYFEIEVDLSQGQPLQLTGQNNNNYTDEVRIYPKGAQMTTQAIDKKYQLITTVDEKNTMAYFDFDLLGRLETVKDHNKDVVEAYEYNYKEDPCFIDVDFFYSSGQKTINQPITFTALVNFVPGTYTIAWDFKDGSFDTGDVVTHSFANTGTYRVKMTVVHNTLGTHIVEKDLKIIIPTLTAVFGSNPGAGGGTFQAAPSGGIPSYSYVWEKIDLRNDPTGSTWVFAGTGSSQLIQLECGGQVRCTISDSAPTPYQQTVVIRTSVGASPTTNPPCQF